MEKSKIIILKKSMLECQSPLGNQPERAIINTDYYFPSNDTIEKNSAFNRNTTRRTPFSPTGTRARKAKRMVGNEESRDSNQKEETRTTALDKESNNQDDEYDENEYEMEEDIYTLMFTYGISPISIYAFLVVAFQASTIGLFYYDLLQGNAKVNMLNVPVAVDTQVMIVQFMALPLAVMTHEDCTTAIYQLSAKYDPTAVQENFPKASRLGWLFTLFLRFMIGFCLVFISFIQIVQSTTITDLFLNLEAMVFVGNISTFAFWLAEKNFINRHFMESCRRVKNITFKASHGNHRTVIRRICAVTTLGILVAGWTVIVQKQLSGVFLREKACNSFDVSFYDYTLDMNARREHTLAPTRSSNFLGFMRIMRNRANDHELINNHRAFNIP